MSLFFADNLATNGKDLVRKKEKEKKKGKNPKKEHRKRDGLDNVKDTEQCIGCVGSAKRVSRLLQKRDERSQGCRDLPHGWSSRPVANHRRLQISGSKRCQEAQPRLGKKTGGVPEFCETDGASVHPPHSRGAGLVFGFGKDRPGETLCVDETEKRGLDGERSA